jgi:hypothetical protein
MVISSKNNAALKFTVLTNIIHHMKQGVIKPLVTTSLIGDLSSNTCRIRRKEPYRKIILIVAD